MGTAKQNGQLFSPKFMRVFLEPDEDLESDSVKWTTWFYMSKLHASRDGKDLALELIEDYDGRRVFGMAVVVLMTLLLLSVIWIVEGGDASYVSTVMSYVLTFLAGKG